MTPTYHIVSHSHWDREWYKSFEQFRSMLVNMVDDLIDLIERDPGFVCFTLDGQMVILEDYLAVRPEREDLLRRLVQEGRLVIGPWYILPDEFLVSGEATVRNLLHGGAMARRFGGEMRVGYIPDSFGHIAMMPAILNGFDIHNALVYRGFGGEPDQKSSEYWWRAPDGTRCLLVHLFRHGYSAGYFHQESDDQIVQRFRGLKDEVDARAATSHRLIMNGGDHHWPDPRLPHTLDLLRNHFEGRFLHSSVQQYVDAVRPEVSSLPEIAGELRFGYRYAFAVLGGVYSSRMYLKQANWRAQSLLQRYAEPLNAFATTLGMRSQLPLLRQAWRTLLKNHPHDSICGCSVDPVHREMMTRFSAVQDIGGSIVEAALEHLVPVDDRASEDDRMLLFFNPSARPRSDIARAEIRFYLQDIVVGLNPDVQVAPRREPVKGFVLLDGHGRETPYQILKHGDDYDLTPSKYNYPKQTYAEQYSVLVDARAVPPLGFSGLTIRKTERMPRYRSKLKAGRNFLENEQVRVEVNAKGEVTVRDKTTGRVFRKLHVLEDSGDVGDEYNYAYPRRDRRMLSNKERWRVSVAERGPLRAALRLHGSMRVPGGAAPSRRARGTAMITMPVTTTISLTLTSRMVTFETTVDNNARDHRLRVLLPTGMATDTVTVDEHFTLVDRTTRRYDLREFTIEHPAAVAPMQRFVAVRDDSAACVLLSDGLPEYELLPDGRGTLALTLLRCVGLLAGEDLITRPGGKAGWHNATPEAQCPGLHTFRYAFIALRADEWRSYRPVEEACECFHYPFMPIRRKNPDPLPMEASFLSVPGGQLTLSACKVAEDGDGVVIRLNNPTEGEVEETVVFARPPVRVAETRLDETVIRPLELAGGRELRVRVGPSGILTIKTWFNA